MARTRTVKKGSGRRGVLKPLKNNKKKEAKKTKLDKLLHSLYYDIDKASAFSGRENIYRAARQILPTLKREDVNDWFAKETTYTLHKPVRFKFPRNKTVVMAIDDQWQADLCDMRSLADYNDGRTFILTCIDCFSKHGWAEALIDKTGAEILAALKRIFKNGRKPKRLQTDKGSEFINSKVQRFLRDKNIDFFTTNSEMKASIVERYNRTLKGRMYKYFTAENTNRYIDALPSLVKGYNHSFHRSIKMKPINVDLHDQVAIRQNLYGTHKKLKKRHSAPKKYKYMIGDLVRISKARRVFRKGYLPSWTPEIFIIYDRVDFAQPFYYLRDYNGENLKGGFYAHELQLVREQEEYHIEKVIKTKVQAGKKLHLVKWKGWGEQFNSWIEPAQIRLL